MSKPKDSPLTFLVEGSRGDEYTVTFERYDKDVHAFCTCRAGEKGEYCKHRIALMDGDVSNLLSDNADDVKRLSLLIRGTALENAHKNMCVATEAFNVAKSKLEKAKKSLVKAMYR